MRPLAYLLAALLLPGCLPRGLPGRPRYERDEAAMWRRTAGVLRQERDSARAALKARAFTPTTQQRP